MRKVIRISAAMLLVMAISIGLGYAVKDIELEILKLVFWCSAIVIVLIVIVSTIINVLIERKYRPQNMKALLEKWKEEHEKIAGNIKKVERKIRLYYLLGLVFYVLCIIVVVTSLSTYVALRFNGIDNGLVFYLIGAYILTGIFNGILNTGDGVNYGYDLSDAEFPKLRKMVDEVQKSLNVQNRIELSIFPNNNISVIYDKKIYHIVLGIFPILLLNEDELKAVMYHEVAHIVNKDAYSKRKQQNLISLFYRGFDEDSALFSLGALMFKGAAKVLEVQLTLHEMFISKEVEKRTDELVKNRNLDEAFVQAATKLFYFDLFGSEIGQKYIVPFNSEPPMTYYQDIMNEFYDIIPKRREIYDYIGNHEIEGKMASHPNLASRMKAFGIDKITAEFKADYYEYSEVKKIVAELERLSDQDIESYKVYHQERYVKQKEVITNFETNPTQDLQDWLDYGYAYYTLAEIEKAVEIFNEILAVYPDASQALNALGNIYLRYYYDEKGIDYVMRSAELNLNYRENASIIGDFYQRMGMKEKLDEFREIFVNMMHSHVTEYETMSDISYNTKLKKPTLPTEVLESIHQYVGTLNFVKEIYIVRKDVTKTFYTHIVCILPKEDVTEEDFNDGMNKIFKNLDIREEQFSLIYINSPMLHNKIAKVVDPVVF